MKPSIGRIVHYVSYGTPKGEFVSTCRAAVVTAVGDPDVEEISLCAINPTGLFFHESCLHEEDVKSGGTWHWPEREES
jgi:hypothetical protein